MTTHAPQHASDFEYICNPDGTCHFWYCGKPGKLLVYDDFSPEGGLWFCEECWNEFQGDDANFLTIVEDKRMKTTQHYLTSFFQAIPDIAAMVMVEAIFHYESEGNESYDEEIEHLETFLAEAGYSYVGINNIVYLYNKEEDIIADLDTDDYSWKRTDEGFDPLATVTTLLDAIASTTREQAP